MSSPPIKRFVFSRFNFDDILSPKNIDQVCYIFASGYEQRARHQAEQLLERDPNPDRNNVIVLSFLQFIGEGSRQDNDKFFEENFSTPEKLCAYSFEGVEAYLKRTLASRNRFKKLIVDYSSMPRIWYSRIFAFLSDNNIADEVVFSYSRGSYEQVTNYPTVGYDRVELVSGKPRINKNSETFILGIGLDFKRTYGIWHLLDPTRAIISYGITSDNGGIVERVLDGNREICSWAFDSLPLDLTCFEDTISNLVSCIRQNLYRSDVVLVADGPKPLILAFSIAPIIVGEPGCVAVHVGSVKPKSFRPVDVSAAGPIYSFAVKFIYQPC